MLLSLLIVSFVLLQLCCAELVDTSIGLLTTAETTFITFTFDTNYNPVWAIRNFCRTYGIEDHSCKQFQLGIVGKIYSIDELEQPVIEFADDIITNYYIHPYGIYVSVYVDMASLMRSNVTVFVNIKLSSSDYIHPLLPGNLLYENFMRQICNNYTLPTVSCLAILYEVEFRVLARIWNNKPYVTCP